jgi:hypothetical protein
MYDLILGVLSLPKTFAMLNTTHFLSSKSAPQLFHVTWQIELEDNLHILSFFDQITGRALVITMQKLRLYGILNTKESAYINIFIC